MSFSNRCKNPVVAILLLFVTFLMVVPPTVSAQTTVSTSTSNAATANSIQHKLVTNDNGRNWLFYSDGTNIVYSSCLVSDPCSTDNTKWTAPTAVRSGTDGGAFSIYANSSRDTNIYYAFASTSTDNHHFFYRVGVLNAGGTITWNFPEGSVRTTRLVYATARPSLTVDGSGDLIVVLETCGITFCTSSTQKVGEIWKCVSPIGSCTWSQIFLSGGFDGKDVSWSIYSLNSNKLIFLATGTSGQDTMGFETCPAVCTGTSSWSAFVHTTNFYVPLSSSATTIGDTIYVAGVASLTCCGIRFWTFTYGNTKPSAEVLLYTASNFDQLGAGISTTGTTLVITGLDPSAQTLFHFKSTDLGNTWSGKTTDVTGETNAVATSLVTAPYLSGGCTVGEAWVSGSSSPFSVRYNSFAVC